MEIQPVGMPEFPKLRGGEATKALHDFIRELEEQRGKELTDRQTTALIKFSSGLISSIEANYQSNRIINRLAQKREETRFVTRLKKQLQNTFLKPLPL